MKVTEELKAKQGRPSPGRVAARRWRRSEGRGPRPAPGFAPAGEGTEASRDNTHWPAAPASWSARSPGARCEEFDERPQPPTRRHIQAIRLNDRLDRIEQKVGRGAAHGSLLGRPASHERVSRVEKQIRHALDRMRSRQPDGPVGSFAWGT